MEIQIINVRKAYEECKTLNDNLLTFFSSFLNNYKQDNPNYFVEKNIK